MKKIISMILVIALFASLAVGASAKAWGHKDHGPHHKVENFVEHAYLPGYTLPGELCAEMNDGAWVYQWEDQAGNLIVDKDGNPVWFTSKEITDMEYRRSSTMTKILSLSEGVKLERVNCTQAIGYADMEAAVAEWNATADEDHQIKHMTVFKQRNLNTDGCEGDVEVSVKLWPAAKKNAVVVLAEVEDTWKIVTVSDVGTDEATANVTGATGFAVCMTW